MSQPFSQIGVIAQLRACLGYRSYRRLLLVRLISQCGDGMFQVGLATLFFFSPQHAATVTGVAGAFAVLLIPFTVVGPIAGPFLDRWRRRNVLYYANSLRMGLALVIAICIALSPKNPVIYVLALITLGINRFLLSALSAGQPHTLPAHLLVMANSITPTLGSISAGCGAGGGFLISLFASGAVRNVLALGMAAILFCVAALCALRLSADELGPNRHAVTNTAWESLRHTVTNMRIATRYLRARGTPFYALGVMATQRFLYGMNFISLLVMSRHLLVKSGDITAGLKIFATIAAISFVGNALAILVTPAVCRYCQPAYWIVSCLCCGMISQLLLATSYARPVLYVSAVLLGFAVQGGKIAVDSIVQSDTEDHVRGRAFALYDMMYNASFVAAAFLAALTLPQSGWQPKLCLVLAAVYLVAAGCYARAIRRVGNAPR
ncbi:MFS transporter [Trueperella sp. LYQ143]|uniref:MFS transporter n=1 Tax=Trueperella sp. LYQ143 TaxID=3391059 RepID=UPI0039830C42